MHKKVLTSNGGCILLKKICEIGLVVLMAIGVVFSMVGCAGIGNPKVNLNDYVKVEVEGYDGHGSILTFEVDYEALAETYGDRAENCEIDSEGEYRYVFDFEKYPDWEGSWAYSYNNSKSPEELAKNAFYFECPELSEKTYEETGEPHEGIANRTLSNGDKLEIVWVVDENTEEDIKVLEAIFNIDIVYEDFTHTINGLEEVKEYN